RRLGAYLSAHPGERVCYTCLTDALRLDHDGIRRASWGLKDHPGVSIRPARCGLCGHRGITIALAAGAELTSTPSATESLPMTDSVAAYLRARPGFPFCAHCLARELGLD